MSLNYFKNKTVILLAVVILIIVLTVLGMIFYKHGYTKGLTTKQSFIDKYENTELDKSDSDDASTDEREYQINMDYEELDENAANMDTSGSSSNNPITQISEPDVMSMDYEKLDEGAADMNP